MTEKPTDSSQTKRTVKKDRRLAAMKKRLILKHFVGAAGNVTALCDQAKICRYTYYQWIKEDPEYAAALEERQEGLLDFAESALFGLMKDKVPSSIIFYLKTKGRKRGYVEHVEHSIPDGIQATINIGMEIIQTRQDDSDMDEDIEGEIQKELLGDDSQE